MRIKIIFILLFILLFMLAGFVYGAIPAKERAALIALYESTDGDGWTNRDGWKKGDNFSGSGSEGTWYGVSVSHNYDTSGDYVTSIDLNNNNLAGTIPSKLGNLTNLKWLYLYNNQLTGTIPVELGNLSNLLGLSLVYNQLSGSIPAELGNLANLKRLYLYYNRLTGSIPVELGNLSNLVHLYLNDNQLSGAIPAELGGLSELQRLFLNGNQLTGSIPRGLGNLSKLVDLHLNNNLLDGPIPLELGNLAKLKTLYLSSNKHTGIIPATLGNLSDLQELYLNNNKLTESIPIELCALFKLMELSLGSNGLKGNILPQLGNLKNLKKLYLQNNQLSGSIPVEPGQFKNLIILSLGSNNLEGNIPSGLSDLSKLEILNLSNNRLEGNIPSSLTDLKNLLVMHLNSNKLEGLIPDDIKSLKHLQYDSSDFRWNALFTEDADDSLKEFLNSIQMGGIWETTQTITPKDVKVRAFPGNSVEVSWTPITYSYDPGRYDVFYSLNSDDTNAPFISSTSKIESSLEVTGLIPDITYYFVVRTRTDPNPYNKNIVYSKQSAEVSALTIDFDKIISGKVTDAAGVGVEGVTLTFSNQGIENNTAITGADGTYAHKVPSGWNGNVTPSKDNLLFSPQRRDYQDIKIDAPGQDYRLSVLLTLSATWEEDKAAIIKIGYGKISISYSLFQPEGLAVKEFNIYRKVSGGQYEAIKNFPREVDKITGEFSYNDKYFDKNKTYTYIARAIDNNNNTVGESNEITLKANN